MTISIIGFGNMGSALIKSFLLQKRVKPSDVVVCDPNPKKFPELKKKGITTSTENAKALDTDILIIAVKPQVFGELATTMKGKLREDTTVLSIMAGVNIPKIQQHLEHQKVVRAMPNTPCLVGSGVTGWYAGKEIKKKERTVIQKLLQSTGEAYELSSEAQIDDFMAISSCGTGFFYQIFDEWLKACKGFDLPQKEMKNILSKTLLGSLVLLESSTDSPQELIGKVASKGGATQAGLDILTKAKLENLFAKTLKAAYTRSKNLG